MTAPSPRSLRSERRAHKTVNLALGIVRRILNLAAQSWRDDQGNTWLAHAPSITMLPLVGHQREPRPIAWAEQCALLPRLPDHLARMTLFALNTGVRDDVVCSLHWAWEIKVPELGRGLRGAARAREGPTAGAGGGAQQRGAVGGRVRARPARSSSSYTAAGRSRTPISRPPCRTAGSDDQQLGLAASAA
jgi:hypothetical protein